MRSERAAAGSVKWVFAALLTALGLNCAAVLGSTSPPHEYYVLSPEPLSGSLSVMSLEPNNSITFGSYQLTLAQYETATVPSTAFTSGTKFSGTGFFTVGSNENAADLLVPDDFAGTSFVVPHISGSHKYYLLSPSGTAQVTIQLGASTFNLSATEGVVNEFDAGSSNTLAGRIISDVPIVLAHVAYVSGVAVYAYPVAPAANELFGIRSQNTIVGALSDGTSITAYASNGSSDTYLLNAGEQVAITTGIAGTQGQGNALHVIANAPIAAVQYDDGDGTDATAFWSAGSFGRRHGVPVNTQYLAVACDQPSVTLTLYKGANAPETQNCSGSSTTPGKAYFGANASGANLSAGWYLISSSPVYVMYEAASSEDEHNLLGLTPAAGPAEPILNTVSSPTSSNPQSISGTAGSSQLVRLYVNGLLQATTTADGSGAYAFNAILIDGTNTLYTTAVASGNESDPSTAMTVEYVNTIPRSQSGTISGTVVWTPGSPATAYTVTAADLTVAAGAQLILQPGTEVRFGSGRRLTVNGTLVANGTATSGVTFTSNLASPTRGSWIGLVINSTASNVVIERATIEWAQTAVSVNGAAATIRNNTIRYFSSYGIYVSGAAASGAVIEGNLIDNLNDTQSCIYTNGSSPSILGNTVKNCDYGIHVVGSSTASITGNNIITGNDYGLYVNANSGTAARPVVTGNQIYSNDDYNYYVLAFGSGGSGVKLDATGNWWGSADPTTISAKISDLTDAFTSSLPTVDYSNFLDGPNGNPVPGNYLLGRLTGSTTLTAGSTYDVLGALFVNGSATLTIPAGTNVRFHGSSLLIVDGAFSVQGSAGNLATFTSARATPARGDWRGILIRGGGALIEYARIEYATTAVNFAGVAGTVRNSTIRYFSNYGVYVDGSGASGAVIEGNVIDNLNDTQSCIYTNGSSPSIIGNTVKNCDYGINVVGSSTASITGNNIITGNDYGLYVNANGGTAARPVVTGNQIYSNDSYNYYVLAFGSGGSAVKLNATANWWGGTDAATINDKINDLTDAYTSSLPSVDYANFLDGPNGNPVPGNYLLGKLLSSMTLTAGSTYDVLGTLFANPGVTLTIPAGAVLRFHGSQTRLIADGTLLIQGTSENPVTLTSGRPTPARNDWIGVLIRTSGSLIEHARIEYTYTGVWIGGAAATVRNSTIRYFSTYGVYVEGSGGSGTLIENNVIDNLNDTESCIYTNVSSPSILGNTVRNCDYGIHVFGSSTASITDNNIITGNDYGLYVNANGGTAARPVVTGNQIYSNDDYNYYVLAFGSGGSNVKLDATGNWWGSADPSTIGAAIHDLSDDYMSALPTVNYADFLDGPNGSPVPGNYLSGKLTSSLALTAGEAYEVLGLLYVLPSVSLTIPEGAILKFHGSGARLVVDGTLAIQGTAESRARLTSGLPDPSKGAWQGIEVRSTASSVLIDYAIVEWTVRAVAVNSANVTISNSMIRNFSDSGVHMTNVSAASQINNNYIDNYNSTGYGIYLSASSPAIAGNQIYRTSVGIYAIGASNPTITGNAISNNDRGIVLDGNSSNSASAVPNPTITGNDIFGNATSQMDVYRYGSSNPVVINATGNWWGTATPQGGQHIRFTNGSPSSAANFSSPASAPLNAPVAGNVVLTDYYFSPNADGIKDQTVVSGTLNQSASWTVAIRSPGYVPVRSYTGSGTAISATWDGRDTGGQIVPDGIYTVEVSASGSSGSAVVGVRLATLDNTPPATSITSPSASAVITNVVSVPITGSAHDSYLVNFTLQYGAGTAPSSWSNINSQNTTGIAQGTLGTWAVGSTTGGTGLQNGDYVLRLSTSDKAGNVGLVQVPVTLDLLSITAVTQNRQLMKPTLGEQLQVNFSLSGPATTSLRIYPEAGGSLIKEITEVFSTSGAKSLTWDGRTTAGAYVTENAYSYAIVASDGVRTATYDPPAPGGDGSGSGTVDGSFNANKNDFWKMNYTMNHFGRIRMQVSGCTSPTHYPYNWVPYPPGVHPLIWDGRGANGQPVSGSCNIYFDPPLYMKSNGVIIRATAPVITGTGASPNIEVKSNPYRITHSYEHVSRITYRLDQDAYVTVKLLPPGISDPASAQAIVITSNALQYAQSGGQPVDHVAEWKGYEDLDTNNILVSEEGSYTFAIQATGVSSDATSLYRGALQLWQ